MKESERHVVQKIGQGLLETPILKHFDFSLSAVRKHFFVKNNFNRIINICITLELNLV